MLRNFFYKTRAKKKKNIEETQKSKTMEEKYQNILLKENAVTEVCFEDLKNNILEYFYKLMLTRSVRLVICAQDNAQLILGYLWVFFIGCF